MLNAVFYERIRGPRSEVLGYRGTEVLPRSYPEVPALHPVHEFCSPGPRVAKRRTILLVEDETEIRRLYALGLNNQGFEVKLAVNGADAMQRLDELAPDVILLDLMLPVVSGWEVLERFSMSGAAHPPVIVVSGEPAPSVPDHRIAAWLAKPVSIEQIVEAVEAALAQSA